MPSFFIASNTRRIAGLNEKKAKAIVQWREKEGGFVNREQLKKVRGIGNKSYEQCVGFVRILRAAGQRTQGASEMQTLTKIQGAYEKEPDVFITQPSRPNAKKEPDVIIIDSDDGELPGPSRKRKAKEKSSKGSKKIKVDGNTQDFLDMTWIHPETYDIAKK